jgi:hypothetical protein
MRVQDRQTRNAVNRAFTQAWHRIILASHRIA